MMGAIVHASGAAACPCTTLSSAALLRGSWGPKRFRAVPGDTGVRALGVPCAALALVDAVVKLFVSKSMLAPG